MSEVDEEIPEVLHKAAIADEAKTQVGLANTENGLQEVHFDFVVVSEEAPGSIWMR
jgi:hypothetical protein